MRPLCGELAVLPSLRLLCLSPEARVCVVAEPAVTLRMVDVQGERQIPKYRPKQTVFPGFP